MIAAAQRVLAIGAHPDDIELGCFGMLVCVAAASKHALVLSTLAEDGFDLQRIRESQRAMRDGAIDFTWREWPHARFVPDQHTVREVTEVIEQVQPDLVLTHTDWDTHQDHRAVAAITLAACRRRPITILGYQTISTMPDFPANLWVDISKVFDQKLQALRCFESMQAQPYMQPGWLRAWHHDRAATATGLGLVEAFHIYQAFA